MTTTAPLHLRQPRRRPPSATETGIVELVKILQRLQRPDLAQRATAAAARLKRPSTIVCVVGEFKQGKSSLVNGLLGQTICPVDDDLATSAITLVRFGEQAVATVKRKREDGSAVSEAVAIDQLGDWVSEAGNPRNEKNVERVEITVPSPLLKQGLVVVDTPGMGGLGAGHAAATLAFLPFADGLIFVSDASAELSAPEVDFLRRATELCPTVMFALTKIDLYPQWERIAELDRGHLERHASARADGRRVERRARRRARPQGPRAQRAQPLPGARQGARRPGRRSGQGRRCRPLGQRGAVDRGDGAHRSRGREVGARRRVGDEGRARAAGGGEATPRVPARPRRPLVDDRQRPHRRPLQQRDVRVPRRRCARSRATWTRWSRG